MKYYIARPMHSLFSTKSIDSVRLLIKDDDKGYIIPASKILNYLSLSDYSQLIVKSENEPDCNEVEKRIIASKNFDITLLEFDAKKFTIENPLDLTTANFWGLYIKNNTTLIPPLDRHLAIMVKNEPIEFDSDDDAKLWFEMKYKQ